MDELPEHSEGKNALKQIHNIVVNYYLLDTKKNCIFPPGDVFL